MEVSLQPSQRENFGSKIQSQQCHKSLYNTGRKCVTIMFLSNYELTVFTVVHMKMFAGGSFEKQKQLDLVRLKKIFIMSFLT